MRAIDGDALYEKTAEWEAQALAHIEELNRTPLEEMTVEERAEWRRWAAILGERSAFMHDIADAPTIDVVPTDFHDKCMKVEIEKRMALEPKHGQWIRDAENFGKYYCSECGMPHTEIEVKTHRYCFNCGADIGRMDGGE